MAAECALLGICWLVCALPVVTAGAATSAAADVVCGWADQREPPLLRTFATALRRQTTPLLLPQLAFAAAAAALILEIRVALAGLPAGQLVAAGLATLAAILAASFALMFPVHAMHGGSWWASWRRAAAALRTRPLLLPGVALAVAVPAILAWIFPPLALIAAGPAAFAITAAYLRAGAP
jgi:uncharacterized membrane protein YesL